ncbi:ATP-binding protein [Synechococcus sp. PCC 7336]|uniref:ATP-binding protein n=1 Tax=Synechococcus sp. PCC 7336 TaxID=195250 RepID=UPI0003481737|nr:ATP-binding protein [Synechococcus sp. PCC 7336]
MLASINVELVEHLEKRTLALEQIAEHWQLLGQPTLQNWKAEAEQLVEGFGEYQAIAWVAPVAVNTQPQQVREFMLREEVQTIFPGTDASTPDLLTSIPTALEQSSEEFIFRSFDRQEFFSDVTDRVLRNFFDQFSVAIYREDTELYQHGDQSLLKRWIAEELFEFEGLTWRIQVWPKAQYFAERHSILPEALLGLELLLAMMLAWIVHRDRAARHLNANLEKAVRDRTARLQQALNFESALKGITERVRDSLDEEHIILTVLQELTATLQANSCNIVFYDEAQTQIRAVYQYPEQSLSIVRPLKESISKPSQEFQPLPTSQSMQFCQLESPSRQQRSTILACPVFGERQILLGDIYLRCPLEKSFTQTEVRLAEQVASQCAIAIHQARCYRSAQQKVEWLEHINHLKDNFLNTVSHELRSPLTNLRVALYMMSNAPSEDKRQKYFQLALKQCEREVELVNDLLDLQRIETSHYEPESEVIDAGAFLHDIAEAAEIRAFEDGHEFLIDVSETLGSLQTDPKYLASVVRELLSNASKYTAPGGKIELRAKWMEEELEICVANTAEIPTEALPHLFEKFYRVPRMDRWNKGGTGLGLSLVKEMVEQLEGKIAVARQKDVTAFIVCLPQLNTSRNAAFSRKPLVRQSSDPNIFEAGELLALGCQTSG